MAILLLAGNISVAQQTTVAFPKLTGPYLGQKIPGKIPEPFADSVFGSRYERFHTMISFSPDGKEAYWQAREKKSLANDPKKEGIFMSKIEKGLWTPPVPASFSMVNKNDDAPTFSPDGKRLYFLTTRSDEHGEINGDENIWYADKVNDTWTDPKPLPATINSMKLIHWGISVDSEYNLYFGVRPTMDLRDGYHGDIYCSKYTNGKYSQPEKLPATVNIPGYKFSPYISADGDFLLFTHIGSKEDHYKIMISFRENDGNWSKAKEINKVISMSNIDIINPYVSSDGKYFFFSRIINGRHPKPCWADASFIEELKNFTTVPFFSDHNRMLVDAEMQRMDGTWRKVRLWVDSGSPEFFISEPLARDLGIDLSATEDPTFKSANFDIDAPTGVRIGGMDLNFEGVKSRVKFQPYWLFSTMQSDGNLPATLLKKYHVVFDYPKQQLTIAEPGSLKPKGAGSPANIHPQTGIVQMDALIDGDRCSLALDMGASYSFISEERLLKHADKHPEWPRVTGTAGCANMWGWWPANEQNFPVVRIPQVIWGNEVFSNIGMVGVTRFSTSGQTFGEWYSGKTAKPVDGFLGPNALKDFRVEIDYANSRVYFEKVKDHDQGEMDLVGISLHQLPDGNYQVVGIVQRKGKPVVQGVEPEDLMISIDDFKTQGKTMGTAVNMLRGKPGEIRILGIEREGKRFRTAAKVEHIL